MTAAQFIGRTPDLFPIQSESLRGPGEIDDFYDVMNAYFSSIQPDHRHFAG